MLHQLLPVGFIWQKFIIDFYIEFYKIKLSCINLINKNFLTRAANNVERLNFIVEDLEEISRLETGEMKLDIQTFGIRKLSEEVIEDLEMTAEEMNIELLLKEGAEKERQVAIEKSRKEDCISGNNSLVFIILIFYFLRILSAK